MFVKYCNSKAELSAYEQSKQTHLLITYETVYNTLKDDSYIYCNLSFSNYLRRYKFACSMRIVKKMNDYLPPFHHKKISCRIIISKTVPDFCDGHSLSQRDMCI